jgi:PIN domain nuclease of toxin-antitoxin system
MRNGTPSVVVLDTNALIFDALQPKRLTARALRSIESATARGDIACSDISLWEIAMLVAKGRLDPGVGLTQFLHDVIQARGLHVLPITPEIAVLAQSEHFTHGDPADRIIAATAMHFNAKLVSADAQIRKLKSLEVVW